MGSVGNKKNKGLGIEGLKKVLGEDVEDQYYTQPDFLNALSKVDLEYNEDGEIIFSVYATDKETGESRILEVSGRDKKSALNDVRKNGYTATRVYTKQMHRALIDYGNGRKWELRDATRVDNELLKKAKRR